MVNRCHLTEVIAFKKLQIKICDVIAERNSQSLIHERKFPSLVLLYQNSVFAVLPLS